MTVHVLMPVFNRLAMTRKMLDSLRSQNTDEPFNLIIVDDGSTDGTAEYLAAQQDVTVLQGNGTLFWGGGMDMALKQVLELAAPDDWILMVNNDTEINAEFLQCLLDTARRNRPAAVGSVIRCEDEPHKLLSVGVRIDSWRMLIDDELNLVSPDIREKHFTGTIEVDALSGRGVLFPVSAIRACGGMRPRWLPHYLADYELSVRVKKTGCRLLVDCNAAVYSKDEYGNSYRASSWYQKFFSIRSPLYLSALLVFWWEASNWLQRVSFPIRLVVFMAFPRLRRSRK